MIRHRYIEMIRRIALKHGKMAFITGPRQVGKTTLARQFLVSNKGGEYFTWDDVEFRRAWARDPKLLIPQPIGGKPLVIFDEIHKAPHWKGRLKGVYDTRGQAADIIVTGSARLDLFRRGGDSLLGRYFLFRLHPLSVGEVAGSDPVSPDSLVASLGTVRRATAASPLENLLARGGFPEPFLESDPTFHNVWRRSRSERLVREDLLDITRAHEIGLIETAAALLPERVGSLLSVQALAEDLEVSHPTMRRWITWFTYLYLAFLVPPYAKRIARSVKKQPKLYLWDWSEVTSPAARFENLIASHLLKAAHFWTDSGLGTFELCFLRDKEKREVDFLVLRDRSPWLMIECKLATTAPSPHLGRFAAALRPAIALQVVGTPEVHEWFDLGSKEKGMQISAGTFLRWLA